MSDDAGTEGTAPTGNDSDTGSDGGDWRSNLPDSLVSAPYFRSADSLEAAIADIKYAAEVQGNSLRIPGPDASDEARAAFYDKIVERAPGVMRKPDIDNDDAVAAVLRDLGKPDEAKDYVLEANEDINLTDERVGQLKDFAHQAGLTKSQFNKFMGLLSERNIMELANLNSEREANLSQLKGEWGAAYDQKRGKIRKVLEMAGADDGLMAAFDNDQLGAGDLRMFENLAGRLTGEGGAVSGQGKSEPAPIMTPVEATLQLKELEDRLIGVYDLAPDQKQALMKRRMELMKLAHPDSSEDDSMLRRSIYGS